MKISEKQRTGISLLVAAGMGVGGLWYGVDYYKSAAGCDKEYRAQTAQVTQIRSALATEQFEAVNTLLNGLGDLINSPHPAGAVAYRELFLDFRMTTDRVAKGRAANPLPVPPEGCNP